MYKQINGLFHLAQEAAVPEEKSAQQAGCTWVCCFQEILVRIALERNWPKDFMSCTCRELVLTKNTLTLPPRLCTLILCCLHWCHSAITQVRSDAGGSHAPAVARGNHAEDGELPPGVSLHKGQPTNASPFFQVLLPTGFLFEARKSKAVSFMGSTSFVKGTRRTEQQAKSCCLSWSWQWWNSLSVSDRSAIQSGVDKSGGSSPSRKKRKVWGQTTNWLKGGVENRCCCWCSQCFMAMMWSR